MGAGHPLSNGGVVRVEPAGLELEVRPGETLMAAAARQGYAWPTVCQGQAVCKACHVRIREGDEHVVPPGHLEAEALRNLEGTAMGRAGARLACQLEISGPVTVYKRGWRPDAVATTKGQGTGPG